MASSRNSSSAQSLTVETPGCWIFFHTWIEKDGHFQKAEKRAVFYETINVDAVRYFRDPHRDPSESFAVLLTEIGRGGDIRTGVYNVEPVEDRPGAMEVTVTWHNNNGPFTEKKYYYSVRDPPPPYAAPPYSR